MSVHIPVRRARIMFWVVCAGFLASCAGMHESPDFERHRLSQLVVPAERNDVFFLDVMVNAQYPADDPAAEELRMEWLTAWLAVRGMCPGGYEIVQRREFGFLERNPGRFDYRYEVKCSTVLPSG